MSSSVESGSARVATAHGKVIVGGEHAVVYGCPALACAIPDGLWLEATPSSGPLTLQIPDWKLQRQVPEILSDQADRLDRALHAVFRACAKSPRGYMIQGRSSLQPGAGLGSSAALCVALAKLLLDPQAPPQTILACAMAGEQVFHGKASGIDTQLALQGGILRFVRGQLPIPLQLSQPLTLWVIHSGRPRQSANMVQGVSDRLGRFPQLADPMWALFSSLVANQQDALLHHDLPSLGEAMNIQHGLLSALGVSTPELNTLCAAAHKAGALGAKLTGAGGGGCVLALPPPGVTSPQFAKALDDALAGLQFAVASHQPLEISAS